ncbi:MAG: hypothetical protein ACI39N_08020 [Lachnospiraceae bacterium]
MQIKVLGITLTDLGLREALRQTDIFLKSGALNTIAYVSMQKLVLASENEEEKQWLEEMDMTICEDAEVLQAAGITNRSRIRETEKNEYLVELLRRIKHNNYTTFLFTDTEKNLVRLEEELHSIMHGLPIKGHASLEEYGENREGIWNAMNVVAPKVIISRFPYPEGMKLMHECRMLLNGEIWITLPEHINAEKKKSVLSNLEQYFYKRRFTKKLIHFQEENQEENR